MCYCIYQQYHLKHQNKHFLHCCHIFVNLIFQCSNKSFRNNRFSFTVCRIHFYVIVFQNSLPWSTHILFVFLFELSKMFSNALTIVTPFLSFRGSTQACLLQISMTHNKTEFFCCICLLIAYQQDLLHKYCL